MTKYEQWNIQSGTIDLLVGGTPCQSFSVAGLRQGLKDPRGNLMLTYLAIAERFKPRWLVWENVPGVLSSNGGKDFGSFLGALGELGYVDWAYRVLDAQWFGVAQRRRRVFVVAHLGKGSLAAKVLFESESVCRDTPPSREARQGVATNVEAGVGSGEGVGAFRMQAFGEYADDGTASAMKARDYKDATDLVASPIVIDRAAFNQGQNAQYKPHIAHSETMDSLVAKGPHAVLTMRESGQGYWMEDSKAGTLRAEGENRPSRPSNVIAQSSMAVRRLTPRECERLQGFNDDHTMIPWRNKPADQCPDGPRYKALGNSMAVPCMAWIGKRIDAVERNMK
jgi:DNA (cytosine-5)-methyltransferase 1